VSGSCAVGGSISARHGVVCRVSLSLQSTSSSASGVDVGVVGDEGCRELPSDDSSSDRVSGIVERSSGVDFEGLEKGIRVVKGYCTMLATLFELIGKGRNNCNRNSVVVLPFGQ
jgi:hypothetical protein